MPAPRYRKRRAASLYAASRFVLTVAVVLALFVAVTVAGRVVGLAGLGRRGLEPEQWVGLAVVAALAIASRIGMAVAHRIEYPPTEIVREPAEPAWHPWREAGEVVDVAPTQRRPVVEPTEILPACDDDEIAERIAAAIRGLNRE